MERNFKHYVRLSDSEDIIHIFSIASEEPQEGDIEIYDGACRLPQQRADDPIGGDLFDEHGRYRYQYIDGEIVLKDLPAIIPPTDGEIADINRAAAYRRISDPLALEIILDTIKQHDRIPTKAELKPVYDKKDLIKIKYPKG